MQAEFEQLAEAKNQKRGRWILILLILFFAVPVMAVMLMHDYDWQPKSGSSRGELITPVRLLQMPSQLLDAHGQAIKREVWRNKWSMVYIADDCNEVCRQQLHHMRQLHVSFAKDIDRVQRVFLTASANVSEMQNTYPDLIIINQPLEALVSLTRQFEIAGEQATKETRIYLVDPLGNLMMSYPDTLSPADIRKDLERLLRYSWAG